MMDKNEFVSAMASYRASTFLIKRFHGNLHTISIGRAEFKGNHALEGFLLQGRL
jgi:hypothetical protein